MRRQSSGNRWATFLKLLASVMPPEVGQRSRRRHLGGSYTVNAVPQRRRSEQWVGLTLQHTNRDVLVEGPGIEIVRVRTRRLAAGGSR